MFVVMKQLLSLLAYHWLLVLSSQMMISFTDAALVAHLGVQALSGTMLALTMFSFVMLLGLGIITAVAPKLAESFRKQDRYALKAWFDQGIWLSPFDWHDEYDHFTQHEEYFMSFGTRRGNCPYRAGI